MNTSTTGVGRLRETWDAIVHGFIVGKGVESGRLSAEQARVLMTGSAESGEPRIVRLDVARA